MDVRRGLGGQRSLFKRTENEQKQEGKNEQQMFIGSDRIPLAGQGNNVF